MSFSENGAANGMVMPVSPMGAYGYGGGMGNWGDGSFWIIVLFLFALMGNGFGGGFGGFNGGMLPFMMNNNTNNDVQRGFDQQSVMGGINGLTSAVSNGFANTQTAICGVNQGVSNGFAQAEIAANARQIADMQQNFASQTAITAGLNTVANNLSTCCCENRASVADLKYTVATEACNDRAAVNDALQAVTAQNNANTQRILDQMCNDKIDAKNEKIAELQNQLTMANLAASQNAQTAAILNDNLAQTNTLEQYLAPVPRPAYIVQNPNGCGSCNSWSTLGNGFIA